ncbi:tRNA (adenosine(37)-N6)-threonylcarbamoyltransferase complex ATPase subunit type 1 TsaE [Shimia sagamensis]|uniref:tRNA threonylcarbamoyladenosine biosynthesis protein TsaE n=1 Tax=Shimia sagamensis TaxID=1566352 RepID=A0ABY1NCY1_9RHOB|nr:tRNA (adenosine(37)-N6)-threonylcarbamoyltransferase complex ATPase subunit type 1 TsaE [Shimia sagamensis]SMP06402.1 tRNA threonylcarbamoyladenosine biosynthesis protein TsaE [Shimia sagamensis]
MTAFSRTVTLKSPSETQALAIQISATLSAGDVLLLEGPIGAGKTHFARSLIQALLPVQEDVPSPTFTLVQVYDGPESEIWHADLYRLSAPDEVVELGLTDAFEEAICLVEWPDRLAELAPENALYLRFDVSKQAEHRQLTISWASPHWSKKLERIAK